MKKLLVLLAFLPVAPAIAMATTAPAIDASNLPPGTVMPTTCSARLDKLVADLQTKNLGGADTVLMVGSTAYAESPTLPASGGGFNPVGGSAKLVGSKIEGTSKVAVPGPNASSSPLTYVISKVDGNARISWTFKGKTYASSADNCSGGYWSAATASSAIVVKLGALQSPPA
jgi:hypothetical protein